MLNINGTSVKKLDQLFNDQQSKHKDSLHEISYSVSDWVDLDFSSSKHRQLFNEKIDKILKKKDE